MIRNKIEQIWFNHVYPCLQNNSYLPLDLTKQFQILIILTSDFKQKSQIGHFSGKSSYLGAREQFIFFNLFLCGHLKVTYSVYHFQIFQNSAYNDFLIESFEDFEDFWNFSLPNDGLKFSNFSRFWKFSKLLTRLNFENFDRIFRELHRTRNRDLSVSVAWLINAVGSFLDHKCIFSDQQFSITKTLFHDQIDKLNWKRRYFDISVHKNENFANFSRNFAIFTRKESFLPLMAEKMFNHGPVYVYVQLVSFSWSVVPP